MNKEQKMNKIEAALLTLEQEGRVKRVMVDGKEMWQAVQKPVDKKVKKK